MKRRLPRPALSTSQLAWGARLLVLILLVGLLPAPIPPAFTQSVEQGDAALWAHDAATALRAYQDALARRPGDPVLFARMIEAATQAGRADMAAAYRAEMVRLDGWTPDQLRAEGDAVAALNDADRAAPYWAASLSGAPQDKAVLRRLVDRALSVQDWERAARWLDEVQRLDPSDVESAFHAALLRAPVAPTDAISALDRAAADPKVAPGVEAVRAVLAQYGGATRGELAFRLGLAMSNLGEWAYAERAFRVALDEERANPAALAFLGLAQDHTGRDGWPPIRQALDLAPNDALVSYAAGVHWRLNGDAARALEALQAARTLDGQNPAIAAELGLAYRDAGQPSEALLYLTTATELAPDDAAFRRLLASFLADSSYDLTGQGLALLRKMADEAPDDAEVQASLGWALMAARDMAAASEALNRAVALDSENPRARFYFAALLEMEGDLDGALDSYRFVAASPDAGSFAERARRAIGRLVGG